MQLFSTCFVYMQWLTAVVAIEHKAYTVISKHSAEVVGATVSVSPVTTANNAKYFVL